MKQFALLMAIVGLAATGCTQNRVFGPHARRGGTDFQVARSQSAQRPNIRAELSNASQGYGEAAHENQESDIKLAGFLGGKGRKGRKGCDDTCCGDDCCGGCCDIESECGCPDECCGGDDCCDGCCDTACCCDGGCADGCCSDGSCGLGGCSSGSCSSSGCNSGGGCSACGGRGCGLCQRMIGRVASGFCPHSGGYPASYNYNPSPPSGQVAYPYYTVRGPRDFLRNNPPSIGPY